MNQPSSTIKAAGLAGLGMGVIWGGVKTYWPDLQLDPMLVSGSTTFVSALVGYLKPERVLK